MSWISRAILGAAIIGGVTTGASAMDWPTYNRSLTSERFSPLDQINRANVGQLKPVCIYELGAATTFTSGLLVIGRTLYATTPTEMLAIDADDCSLKWRVKEPIPPGREKANRGPAFDEGRLFRGLQDGRVIGYDAANGRQLWATTIADPSKGESLPAAPIAWRGLVFIGNAGGDYYGVRGRMYALDARTGRIVWQSYLTPKGPGDRGMAGAPATENTWGNAADKPITGGATWSSYTLDPNSGLIYIPAGNPAPDFDAATRPGDNLFTNTIVVLDARTGAYRNHYSVIPRDWHDWDVAAPPGLVLTRAGRRVLSVAPKDGHLYAFDLQTRERLYRTPITTIENADTPLTVEGAHFCPGNVGGTEWNGPAYSPQTNLIYTGAVDWCSTISIAPDSKGQGAPGSPWTGAKDNLFGKHDGPASGWISAVDADTGVLRWKFHTPNIQVSGVTPTAGGLVFFGNGDGKAYALDQATGDLLWSADLGAASGGGVITYSVAGKQRLAYAAGLNDRWPTAVQSPAKIVVFGLLR